MTEWSGLDLSRVFRINVVGTSGSGKSTLSRKIAELLHFPYLEMDRIFWKPNWTEPDKAAFAEDIRKAVAGERWVLDGNYDRTAKIKWERVDLVIWVDYSFPRTLCQAILRTLKRSMTRQELWPGTANRESLYRSFFRRDSIVLWTITSYGTVKKRYLEAMANPEWKHLTFIRLRNHRETEEFLNFLRSQATLNSPQ